MARVDPARTGWEWFDRDVARLASQQHGVFTRAQVKALGASRGMIGHRLDASRWERCSRDVLRLAGVPTSWKRSLLAACLAWGALAVASHRAAAALWRLAGFEPGVIELTVPHRWDRAVPGIVHRNALERRDATVVDAIPVTTPARTLIDLAAVAPMPSVEEALDDALRRRLVTIPRLRLRLRGDQRGRSGVGVMRALLEQRAPSAPPPESVFETRLLRALRRARLPDPVLQHRVRRGRRTVAVVDFAYPDVKLAIEADGFRWHSGRADWERDRTRRNVLTLLGWRIIHVTWPDLARPDHVIAAIRAALDAPR